MASYNPAIQLILKHEGGYQNHPNDKGNYNSKGALVGTNYGISAPVLERWKGYPPTEIDVKNLSLTESKEIYNLYFWKPIWGDEIIDQDVAEIIFDHSVNAGTGNGAKLVQKTLNKLGHSLVVDGAIGIKTLTALNNTDPLFFFQAYKEGRVAYYKSISKGTNSVFLNGWINRVSAFEKKKWC
ncbi:hypothetical protein JJL45_09140 [Tamlana sp. s12]|uniref:glycoside hydrolase family 108 protein n=1 Tax=Tamlana sp. s12 TaxID=1630406 RepID=UPI0007FB75B0|nr:glycosyl hydrolase 108 family protein [Tamlana sp. s12]OBQ52879.1 hypothetical protein VQ01_13100 [Tamlana sp. s12]QQY81094.1 hypothetical protein JJL45_09140 [Tamlana sp. s12]